MEYLNDFVLPIFWNWACLLHQQSNKPPLPAKRFPYWKDSNFHHFWGLKWMVTFERGVLLLWLGWVRCTVCKNYIFDKFSFVCSLSLKINKSRTTSLEHCLVTSIGFYWRAHWPVLTSPDSIYHWYFDRHLVKRKFWQSSCPGDNNGAPLRKELLNLYKAAGLPPRNAH